MLDVGIWWWTKAEVSFALPECTSWWERQVLIRQSHKYEHNYAQRYGTGKKKNVLLRYLAREVAASVCRLKEDGSEEARLSRGLSDV